MTDDQIPPPSVDLTPDDLDTALLVVVIRDDGRSRMWIGDSITSGQAANLLHAAASYLPPAGGPAAYALPHERRDPPGDTTGAPPGAGEPDDGTGGP